MVKIEVYYSSATSDLGIKKHQQSLKFLLDKKKAAYTEIDMAQLDKPARDAVYDKAGSRTLPLVFVNDKYVGSYEELQYAEEDGKLDAILA